jgi:hypothetical protein
MQVNGRIEEQAVKLSFTSYALQKQFEILRSWAECTLLRLPENVDGNWGFGRKSELMVEPAHRACVTFAVGSSSTIPQRVALALGQRGEGLGA